MILYLLIIYNILYYILKYEFKSIRGLDCNLRCVEGEVLSLDMNTKKSVCKKCGSNQYRKDSRSSFVSNGEFKFAVNNKEALVDFRITN
jgi:hypothetical protein